MAVIKTNRLCYNVRQKFLQSFLRRWRLKLKKMRTLRNTGSILISYLMRYKDRPSHCPVSSSVLFENMVFLKGSNFSNKRKLFYLPYWLSLLYSHCFTDSHPLKNVIAKIWGTDYSRMWKVLRFWCIDHIDHRRSSLVPVLRSKWTRYRSRRQGRQIFSSFLLMNLRSLSNKFDELVMSINRQQLSIAVLIETWLDETSLDKSLNLQGYLMVRRVRDRRGWLPVLYWWANLCSCSRTFYCIIGSFHAFFAIGLHVHSCSLTLFFIWNSSERDNECI